MKFNLNILKNELDAKHAPLYFIYLGLLIGILYFFITPPLQSPDEFNHFYKAWQISELNFNPVKTKDRLGGPIPESVDEFLTPFRFAAANSEYRFDIKSLRDCWEIKLIHEKKQFADFANTSNYSPLCYIPQALVIALLRPFNPPLALIYYSGRLITFLFWLVAMYYCIKITPVFKWLFSILFLLPTQLFIANSFSADNMTNIVALFWICFVFKLAIENKVISNKQVFILFLVAMILPFMKLVYAGLIILIFLIPKQNFVSRIPQTQFYSIILIMPILLAYLWMKHLASYYIAYADYDPQRVVLATLAPYADYHKQMHLVTSQPLYFVKVMFKSVFNLHQHYLDTYIGAFGATLNERLPTWLWISAFGFIMLILINEKSEIRLTLLQKLIIFSTFSIVLTFILLTLHLYWDPVGSGFVWLVQGRYLIPIIPLFLISIKPQSWRIKININIFALLFILLLNFYSLHIIWNAFYNENAIEKVECDFETGTLEGFFNTDNSKIKFANQNNYSNVEKRTGEFSAMLSELSPYGLTSSPNHDE